MVGRPTRRGVKIWEAHPESWDGLRASQEGPVGVGRGGRGWDGRRRSGVPHVVLGMVERSSRRAGRGREALLGSRDGLRNLLAGPAVLGGVRRPILNAGVWKPFQYS